MTSKSILETNLFDVSHIIDKQKTIISWSPSFDNITYGIEEGSLGLITGPPKVGKTTSCLYLAGKAQKLGYHVYFGNVEGRLSKRDLQSISTLDLSPDKFSIIASTKERLLYGEDYIQCFDEIMRTKERAFLVVDSFSQLCEKELFSYDWEKGFRGTINSTISRFCKQTCNILPINGNICVGITHQYANTSGIGYATTKEGGGSKIQYGNNWKIKITHSKPWIEQDKQIGLLMHAECINSSLAPPNQKSVVKIRFGTGIDEEAEILEAALSLSIVKKAGSWYKYKEGLWQGESKTLAAFKENPAIYQEIKKEYDELIGVLT